MAWTAPPGSQSPAPSRTAVALLLREAVFFRATLNRGGTISWAVVKSKGALLFFHIFQNSFSETQVIGTRTIKKKMETIDFGVEKGLAPVKVKVKWVAYPKAARCVSAHLRHLSP